MPATQMKHRLARVTQRLLDSPASYFHSHQYLRHTARRQEHLASLHIPVSGLKVLELGAGIGDHSHYFMDRGCQVTVTEVRDQNLRHLHDRYPDVDIRRLDMDDPRPVSGGPFDVVYSYGLLYHLRDPGAAIEFMSDHCKRLLFLETCVSFGDALNVNPEREQESVPTQAVSGVGCRPTRPWVFEELKKHFEHVYVPRTQPNHQEFPLDWTAPHRHEGLARSVFVASRVAVDNDLLCPELLMHQRRHE